MKVVRIVTFEGTKEQLIRQLTPSAPAGRYELPGGLTIDIRNTEVPEDMDIRVALAHVPRQWPVHFKVLDGEEEV
jgi:hypothetical protein